jgi:hypothetical protein
VGEQQTRGMPAGTFGAAASAASPGQLQRTALRAMQDGAATPPPGTASSTTIDVAPIEDEPAPLHINCAKWLLIGFNLVFAVSRGVGESTGECC